MLDKSPSVSMAMVSITSPKRPVVDMTWSMFFSDSGMASDYVELNEVKEPTQVRMWCEYCPLTSRTEVNCYAHIEAQAVGTSLVFKMAATHNRLVWCAIQFT